MENKFRQEKDFINKIYGLCDDDHETALSNNHIYDLMVKYRNAGIYDMAIQLIDSISPVVTDVTAHIDRLNSLVTIRKLFNDIAMDIMGITKHQNYSQDYAQNIRKYIDAFLCKTVAEFDMDMVKTDNTTVTDTHADTVLQKPTTIFGLPVKIDIPKDIFITRYILINDLGYNVDIEYGWLYLKTQMDGKRMARYSYSSGSIDEEYTNNAFQEIKKTFGTNAKHDAPSDAQNLIDQILAFDIHIEHDAPSDTQNNVDKSVKSMYDAVQETQHCVKNDVIDIDENGVFFYGSLMCTFGSKKIREELEDNHKPSTFFTLPEQYKIEIVENPSGDVAKIVYANTCKVTIEEFAHDFDLNMLDLKKVLGKEILDIHLHKDNDKEELNIMLEDGKHIEICLLNTGRMHVQSY